MKIKTAADIQSDAKAPWKIRLNGQVESKFIFRTAISKSILPFYLYHPAWITLPITIEKEVGQKHIKLYTSEQLMKEGELKAWRWFANTENIWNINKTEKSATMTNTDRLNFQRGLCAQNLNARYLVLYTASAKDANALVFDRQTLDLEFIVESKTYVFYTNNEKEAYYLAAVLNSSILNHSMKAFQTKGLFGPRDVHKKILNIPFPKYSESQKPHLELAMLSEQCHEKATTFMAQNKYPPNLSAHDLGKVRIDIKKSLSNEFSEIDQLVKRMIYCRNL